MQWEENGLQHLLHVKEAEPKHTGILSNTYIFIYLKKRKKVLARYYFLDYSHNSVLTHLHT